MGVEAGQTLLHYRLVAKIGQGGMGEVWRARDPRLDRDVAVKILPDDVAQSPDRLARFEREAKAVAALAHPNILAVHDFGRDGETTYMVTELLEGESLRERLQHGPLPPSKAAELARQIARGLAAAHEKGFVHRDLKPDNVFITREGRAKILDFGLAAPMASPGPGGSDSAHTPTRTELTAPGAALGTADYMSPEQVRGKDVDHRSDIFSFGVLLHEMLTGRKPFHRDTVAETMTAVLREDPALPSSDDEQGLPPGMGRVVSRCLEKLPGERFQSASDLAFAVDNALGSSTSVTQRVGRPLDSARPRRGRWIAVAVVAAVALLAIGAYIGRHGAPAPTSPPVYSQLTFRQGTISTARFAADGRTIVYAADWDGEGRRLFTVLERTPESRTLNVADAEILSVSPQGEMALLLQPRFIVGWTRRGTLARMPFGGGAPREMLDNIAEADWDRSGQQMAIVRVEEGISRLEYPPGKQLYQTGGWIGDLRFSPDGSLIAFSDHPAMGDDRGFLAVTDHQGNARRLGDVWSSLRGVAWAPGGDEIWFTAGERGTIRALHATDLDENLRVVLRAPADLRLHDVDQAGRVLISRNTSSRGILGRPPGATAEIPLSWMDWSYPAVITNDGRTILFTEQGEGGGPDYSVYLRSTSGGPAVRLGPGHALHLDRSGSKVLARLIEQGSPLVVYHTGAGDTERIQKPGLASMIAAWIGDGSRLFVYGSLDGASSRGYVLDRETDELRQVTPENISPGGLFVHPDLDRLTFRTYSGPLHVTSLDGNDPPVELSGVEPGWQPAGWSDDGRFLYLSALGRVPLPVVRHDIETGKNEPLWELMPADSAGLIDIGPLMVNPAGTAYVYSYRRHLSTLYLADGFNGGP